MFYSCRCGDVAAIPLSRRIAMTAMIDMKLTFSDAFAAFAAIISLTSILYVLHVVVALF